MNKITGKAKGQLDIKRFNVPGTFRSFYQGNCHRKRDRNRKFFSENYKKIDVKLLAF